MIDPNKTYRTRDGRAVRIYSTDAGGSYPVHGAIYMGIDWSLGAWDQDGNEVTGFAGGSNAFNLIEATLADELTEQIPWEALRPEIQWVALSYEDGWFGYQDRLTEQTYDHFLPPLNCLYWGLKGVAMPEVDPSRWRETLCKRPEDK